MNRVIELLKEASDKMILAGNGMKKYDGNIFTHGCELLNAADMIKEWITELEQN